MPKNPEELAKWNMMLDQLGEQYPDAADEVSALQDAMSGANAMGSSEEDDMSAAEDDAFAEPADEAPFPDTEESEYADAATDEDAADENQALPFPKRKKK